LLPSAFGEEVISTNIASGNWTNAATWSDGIIPNSATNSCVITGGTIRTTSAITLSNYTQTGGVVTQGQVITVGGSLTFSEGTFIGNLNSLNLLLENTAITGGMITNVAFVRSVNTSWDVSGLMTNPFVKASQAFNGQIFASDVTNSTLTRVRISTNMKLSLTNVVSSIPLEIGTAAGSAGALVSLTNLTGISNLSFLAGNTTIVVNAHALAMIGTGTINTSIATVSIGGSDLRTTGAATFNTSTTLTNTTLITAGTSTLTPPPTAFDSVTSSGTLTLAGALTTGALTNYSRMTTASNAVTATTLYSTNTITAGASTFTVSNFTATTWSPQTSTVRLTDGGQFNATNAYNLAVVSGSVTLTNAAITTTGTIYSEAPSASLNLSGGTLTVTGQSLFAGTISNGTIGASAPVTAERTQGVSGRINSIEQMGAE
jgi:hypothetical protein